MHPRLLGVLRTINPLIPSDATPAQAWQMIRPSARPYLINSFWQVLGSRLPFTRTPGRQVKLAEWIWEQKTRAERAGEVFPPKPIEVKPALLPQPRIA